MNILSASKWIECKKIDDCGISDRANPWAGIKYSPRPGGKEAQFQPIDNMGGLPMFRRSFVCNTGDNVKITATSLGIYNLWCNGKRVGTKNSESETVYDEFNPGAGVYTKRVMATEYDLGDYIVDGENVILAVVAPGWWRGTIFYDTYGLGLGMAFCAEIDVNGNKIVTDGSWQTLWGGRVRAADFYHGEICDATFASYEELSLADYDTDAWSSPEIWGDEVVIKTWDVGHIPKHRTPIGELEIVPFIGPEVRIRKNLSRKPQSVVIYNGTKDNGSDFGEINVVSTLENKDGFALKKGETAVIDFGQNLVALPDVIFNAEKGSYIQIRVAEMLNDSGLLSRGNDNPKGSLYTINYRGARSKAYYVANGDESGEHYRPTFTFFGFRYIEISATEDITVSSLSALVVGSEIEEVGHIETSSKEVNQLISNILWGQRGNYLSIPTDCPQRDERQGWTGDTQFFCNTAAYNANVLEFFRKWLTDARDSQHDSGAYQDVIPMVRHWGNGGAAWADAPLIVAYVMWCMYADKEILRENIEAFDKYMDWLASNGLGGPAPTYGDWLAYDGIDKKYISKAYYALDVQIMAMLHYVLGNVDKSEDYNELYFAIREDFRNSYVGDDGDLLPDYRKQTGYLLALHTDMFNFDEIDFAADALEKKIVENGYKLSTGFVGTPLICTTLSNVGKSNLAYSLLLQTEDPSWLYSVHQGATTVWERWNSYTHERGFGDVNMNSFNHYSFGAVMEWMYRYMVGIQSLGFAFDRVMFTPKPDMRLDSEIPAGQERITYAKGSYMSKNGPIVSLWRREDDGFTYECEAPVKAEFYLPICEAKDTFIINGIEKQIFDFKTVDGCAVIDLDCGKYSIKY